VTEFVSFLEVAAGIAVVLGGCVLLARRARSRGLGGAAISSAMAAYEEIWQPTAHQSHIEIQVELQRQVPGPVADDKPRHKKSRTIDK
jgi:hypothetical protein